MKTSIAKHTPGPWRVGDKHPDRVFTDRPSVSERRRVCVTAPYGCNTDEADAEDFANARLIALAPEMLAALNFVLSRLECDDGTQAVLYSDALSPKETDDETVLQYLRSLVARAEPPSEAPHPFPQGRYASKERGGV